MAGNLLLTRKSHLSVEKWKEITKIAEVRVIKVFGPYFSRINTLIADQDCLVIGFRHDHNRKFHSSIEGDWLTYEGQIFALNEERKLEAEELLTMYKNKGDGFANDLDGHFVIKLFDAKAQEYKIINDFIKNKANFICETDDFIMFTPYALTSSLIKKVELDFHAFNEFMWRYYVMSYRSLLKGVSKIKPASIYSIKQDLSNHKTYWQWPKKYTKRSFEDCVQDMSERVKETARLMTNSYDSVCLDFTMGQDSRQNIVGFTNQDLPFSTMVFGQDEFEEVKEMALLTDKYKIDHHTIQLEDDYTQDLFFHFKRAIILGSCEEPGHLLGRILYMRQKQKSLGEVLLNGMDGHFYKNGLWDELYTFNLYREPKKFNIKTFLNLRALSKDYPDQYYTEELLKIKGNSRTYFSKIAEESIQGYHDSPVSIQVDKFDLNHWLTFAMTANSTCNSISNSVSPMLLRRNMDLALTIPVKWKFNLSRWQRAFVHRLDPRLAAEKTDFGGVTMTPKTWITFPWFFFKYFFFQTKRLRNKILSKLGVDIETHLQEAWHYRPLYIKLVKSNEFNEHLSLTTLTELGIINRDNWQKYLASIQINPTMNDLENLIKVVSVELYLKIALSTGENLTEN